jgi:hypothetical protein
MSPDALADKQNPDGGWPYGRGSSWTEPTAYAVLAMLAAGEKARARKAIAWLKCLERSDGGWRPRPGVEESTWVTALAALVPREEFGRAAHDRAVGWLIDAAGAESGAVVRLRSWLLGEAPNPDVQFAGWPWLEGSAAWVEPTALAILALDKEPGRAKARQRAAEGRRFLMSRRCPAGGWNHGSTHALGYATKEYPETTGRALAALGGEPKPELERSIGLARTFLGESRSADAINWLRLGLTAQGALPQRYRPPEGVVCRTVPEIALDLLISAGPAGYSLLLGHPPDERTQ